MIIRIDYSSEAKVRLDLWGGTSGTFAGIDRFGRVVDQRWVNYSGTPTDVDHYQYGYDRDSNRTWKANGTTTLKDEFYTYDPLNRLTEMQRGTLNGTKTGITGTPVREMDWTLDPTGNWPAYLTKTSGTTDLNQTRTHNLVNEITTFAGTPSWSTPPVYDAAGNMKSFPQSGTPTSAYTALYDAWNRPVSVSDTTPNTVAEYQYDGSNWRTVKKTYSGGTLSETRHFYYTTSWQDVEERVGTSTSADQQYVWGMRYVDELICRDDPTNGRLYAMQDANFNLTGITDTSGVPQERYLFDPYGTRAIYDGSWSSISSSAYNRTFGHQGLATDQETNLIYNRNRMLHPTMGRFLQRDPLGYVDSSNLDEYESSEPTGRVDASGNAGFRWPWQPLPPNPAGQRPFACGYFQWYGNWGGPGWTNGRWIASTDYDHFPSPGDSDYNAPIDEQDSCYEQHDHCYHDAVRVFHLCPGSSASCNYLRGCDNALQGCLSDVFWHGNNKGNIGRLLGALAAFNCTNQNCN